MELDPDKPHSARIYDHMLGGHDNFPADRAAAAAVTAHWPHLGVSMRANRDWMARQARFAAAELGIRQFLDVGSGLPTAPNMHEVVQGVHPACRVLYVDNDPLVLDRGRSVTGATYLDADLHDPEAILASPEFRDTIDLTRPVALSLIAVLQFVTDEDEASSIVDRLLAPLPAGSTLSISSVTDETAPAEVAAGVAVYAAGGIGIRVRDRDEVTALFRGLPLLDPGVVLVNRWRPEKEVPDAHVQMYGGVARKTA